MTAVPAPTASDSFSVNLLFKGPWMIAHINAEGGLNCQSGTPLVKDAFEALEPVHIQALKTLPANPNNAQADLVRDALLQNVIDRIRDHIISHPGQTAETVIQVLDLPPGDTITIVLPQGAADIPFINAYELLPALIRNPQAFPRTKVD